MKKDMKKEGMKKKKVKENNQNYELYFLLFVIFIYIVLFLFKPETAKQSLNASISLIIKIIPMLLVVIIFMGVINYFLSPKFVLNYVGKGSGIKGWFFAASTGILSHGPIYIWYPLLKDLRDQGMRSGLIAVFLYNRAIKIPLLPLMVYYFGLLFVVILLIYMLAASVIQGKLIEMIE